LTINTAGSGDFTARIHSGGTAIDYELTYRDLSSTVLQSHIHFGRPAITGGIVLFLCTNLGNAPASVPVPQVCPETNPATISGTLTAANVIAVPGQGIDSGALGGFAEILKAIRAGAAYVNVHTHDHPGRRDTRSPRTSWVRPQEERIVPRGRIASVPLITAHAG
jgi:hypothetical protein